MLSQLPPCATTGVGSLPFSDVDEAVAHVTDAYEVPFCPQLPLVEGDMVAEWLGADPCCCGWSPERDRERPRAWEPFLEAVDERPPEHGVVKLQVTGPWTLANALGDTGLAGRAGGVAGGLGRRSGAGAARARSASAAGGRRAGAGGGGAEPGRGAARTWDALRAVAPAWGLHVCCRVPWDVRRARAAGRAELRPGRHGPAGPPRARVLERMLRRGGLVAWGICPVGSADEVGPAARWMAEAMATLGARGIGRETLLSRSLVTPSCGTALAEPARERRLAEVVDAVAGAGRGLARAVAARPL